MGETCVCVWVKIIIRQRWGRRVCVCVCEDNHSSKMGERCVGCGPVSLRGKVIWYCLQNTALIDSKTSRPQPCGTLKWVSHSNECTLNGVVWPYCWGVSHLMKADMGKRISPYKVNYNSNDLKMKVETGLSLARWERLSKNVFHSTVDVFTCYVFHEYHTFWFERLRWRS